MRTALIIACCLTAFLILAWIFVTWFLNRALGTPGNAIPVQI